MPLLKKKGSVRLAVRERQPVRHVRRTVQKTPAYVPVAQKTKEKKARVLSVSCTTKDFYAKTDRQLLLALWKSKHLLQPQACPRCGAQLSGHGETSAGACGVLLKRVMSISTLLRQAPTFFLHKRREQAWRSSAMSCNSWCSASIRRRFTWLLA